MRPKIIIIDGHSGAGKSTFAEYLGEYLNCPVIHGDEFLFDSVHVHKEDMKRIFGDYPKDNETGLEYLVRCDNTETIQSTKELFTAIREYVQSRFEQAIEYNNKSKFLVLEWLTACDLNRLWLSADFRIMIDSPQNKRAGFLNENNYKIGKAVHDIQSIRQQAHSSSLKQAKNIDTNIHNDYNEHLKNHAKNISATLLYKI